MPLAMSFWHWPMLPATADGRDWRALLSSPSAIASLGSPSALDAAFLLGRLEESGQAGIGEAVHWYDTYLAGAPSGPYASEALGRKMMATKQLRGSAEAETLAREYLRRFPTGPYAARALLRAASL
jgi:hypothetical protein